MSGYTFDAKYLQYFRERVATASDGTRVPGDEVAAEILAQLPIATGHRVLDVGCSWGRLLPILQRRTDEVFGLDTSYDVIDEAAKAGYRGVVRGTGEETNLPSAWFDHAVLFGVFDCCRQVDALRETRRILKPGGHALITGKNALYHRDDKAALVAERNAKRKSFPNHFTDVALLWERLDDFGLERVGLARFARRGHFGELRTMAADDQGPFYEYVLVVRRAEREPGSELPEIADPISRTVRQMADEAGAVDAEAFLVALPD